MRPFRFGYGIIAFFLVGGVVALVAGSGTAAGVALVPLGAIWIGVSLLLLVVYGLMERAAGRKERIAREGIPAQVTVLDAQQTGTYVNEQPQMRLRLRVQPTDGRPGYDETIRTIVPFIGLAGLGSGRPLPAHIAPDDRSMIIIDWSAAARLGPTNPAPAPTAAPSIEARLRELDLLKARGVLTPEEHAAQRARVIAEV